MDFVQAREACLKASQRFLKTLGKGPANGHGFADRFHRCGQNRVRAREFLKGKARKFGDDIIDRRLKGRRGRARNVIIQLIQRVPNGELGGDLGNGEAGRFRGQRGRARDARVHFDHDHAAIFGVHAKLHVRSACFHADFAQDSKRGIAHDLIFFVS